MKTILLLSAFVLASGAALGAASADSGQCAIVGQYCSYDVPCCMIGDVCNGTCFPSGQPPEQENPSVQNFVTKTLQLADVPAPKSCED